MKYIKQYEDFTINDTDQPDVKMSKDRLNTIQMQMKEYQQKKSLVDKLYSLNKDPKIIEDGLVKILGTTDIKKGGRNPFLVDYVSLVKMKTDVENMDSDNVSDKIKLDDFKRDVATTTDNTMKLSLNNKIVEINKRMQDRVKKISTLNSDIVKAEKDHKDKIAKLTKDIKDFNTKILSM